MTLRETELIGKKLVKAGFFRSNYNHHFYRSGKFHGEITLQFKLLYTNNWYADIELHIDSQTFICYKGQEALFTPEWLISEMNKVKALFQFARV
jgi:hypothetical protein